MAQKGTSCSALIPLEHCDKPVPADYLSVAAFEKEFAMAGYSQRMPPGPGGIRLRHQLGDDLKAEADRAFPSSTPNAGSAPLLSPGPGGSTPLDPDPTEQPITRSSNSAKKVPKLDVYRLKERMELEVCLVREGFRAILFLVFCVLFFLSIFVLTRPQDRSDSVHELQTELELPSIQEGVSLRRQVYGALIQMSSAARVFFPLSSLYVEDSSTQTLITEVKDFPRGPEQLPEESMPLLPIEWSVTTRIRLVNPEDSSPARTAIIKETLTIAGSQEVVCWALYCEGLNRFILEYGQHNMDNGYKIVNVLFSEAKLSTVKMRQMNLVALVVNNTHFTVMLQDADPDSPPKFVGFASAALELGALPSQCSNGKLWVGDYGLELADMTFYPNQVLVSEFDDIIEGGQTLEDIAAGTEKWKAAEAGLEGSSQSQQTSDEVVAAVADSTQHILNVLRSFGTVSGFPERPPAAQVAVLDSPSEQEPLAGSGFMKEEGYMQVLGPTPQDYWYNPDGFLDLLPEPQEAVQSAFETLRANGTKSFTLSYWAKRSQAAHEGLFVILVNETLANTGLYETLTASNELFTGLFGVTRLSESDSRWEVQLSGIVDNCPAWRDGTEEWLAKLICRPELNFWCQDAPGREHSLWRHTAIRYSHSITGGIPGHSEISLFEDGAYLCGQSFPILGDDVAHLREAEPGWKFRTFLFDDSYGATVPGVGLKDMRLYPESLPEPTIRSLGRDPQLVECIDLEELQNNKTFKTSFEQTCSDIATTRVEEGLGVACALPEVQQACPVSCFNYAAPPCWDSIPSTLYVPSTVLPEPQRGNEGNWPNTSWVEGKEWELLWASIETVDEGVVILSADASPEPFMLGLNDTAEAVELCHAATQLNLSSRDVGNVDYHFQASQVVNGMCKASESHWGEPEEESKGAMGNIAYISPEMPGFQPGLCSYNESWTLVFWAKPASASSRFQNIGLTAVDDDGDVCWYINGNTAGVMPYNSSWASSAVDRTKGLSFEHLSLRETPW